MYIFNCDNCKENFERKSNRKRKNNFCSHKCYSVWLKNGNGKSSTSWFRNGHEGYFKGKKFSDEHRKKISLGHSEKSNKFGEDAQNWRGGKIERNGYISIYKPDHPQCSKQGYIFEHRLVVEGIIGRFLTKKEIVHHIDENKSNNNPANLMLFKNSSEHIKHHWKIKHENTKTS